MLRITGLKHCWSHRVQFNSMSDLLATLYSYEGIVALEDIKLLDANGVASVSAQIELFNTRINYSPRYCPPSWLYTHFFFL